jgi:DnaJ-class molecular chaperone
VQQQIIKCAFCKGTGTNPHFTGICPVCKGGGRNQITGKYMVCGHCRGSGQKRGTTLTCYTCAGLGVVPDTREELKKARQEIRKAWAEMEKESKEVYERRNIYLRNYKNQ